MKNIQEKKTWMRTHKPIVSGNYYERLINREWDDYGEQLASMGNIKSLINKIFRT